nr:serine/threonine-protein kinase [uncultured Undibacterium sp.]
MMNNANLWTRAKDILADALSLPEQSRNAFVIEKCGDDHFLRDEIFALLKHAENLTNFIETPAALLTGDASITAASDLDHGISSLKGTRIAAYALTEEIGRGGMGVVYAADRVDGAYQQKVAIKLIRGATQSVADVRRMQIERQSLAELSHPNIARLLDGGTTADGMSYLVMEFIDGVSIDRYCTQHHLDLRARVGLIRQLCDAVQSAHQHLIIHRDIKPSNILVSMQGEPKLLDFGIARMLTASNDDASQTQDVSHLFSPRYASPEQVRGLPVSVTTDVYSLGLLMYELLAGDSPYQRIASNEASNAAAAMQVILEDTPRAASVVAREKQSQFADSLRGDLDCILLKACAKNSSERYATVAQLDDDLQSWLEKRPILARRPSWHYVVGKFILRNRAVTAMGVVALSAAMIGGLSTLQQQQKTQARYTEVRQLANSLIFKYYERIESMGGSTPVLKELAADGISFLDSLAKDADADLTLSVEIARGYRQLMNVMFNGRNLPNLGDKAGADLTGKKAYAILENVLKKDPNHLAANQEMAELETAIGSILSQEGNSQAAIQSMENAAKRYETILQVTPENKEVAFSVTRTYIATAQAAINANLPAEQYLDRGEKALKRWSIGLENDKNLPNMEMFLVRTRYRVAYAAKDYPNALRLAEEEIVGVKKMLLRDIDQENMVLLGHLQSAMAAKGTIYIDLNRLDEAVVVLHESRDIAQKIMSKDLNNISARVRLARIYTHIGRAEYLRKALQPASIAFTTAVGEYAKANQQTMPAFAYQQNAEALWRAASTYQQLGETKTARRFANELLAFAKVNTALFQKAPAQGWLTEANAIMETK